ncbi:MAG: hypothetical protein JW913_19800 [Chitinispirillaceae bacterium]|nr:hypothetical protein [Chitinispirillaceae bacterium]
MLSKLILASKNHDIGYSIKKLSRDVAGKKGQTFLSVGLLLQLFISCVSTLPTPEKERRLWNEARVAARDTDNVRKLAKFARHPNSGIRVTVVENPHVTAAILAHLAYDSSSYVRKTVAKDSMTVDPAVLDRLAGDKNSGVRYYVACNPRTPVATLARLSRDPENSIRQMLPRNKRTSIDIIKQLTNDEDNSVRLSAVEHSSVPQELARKVLEDITRTSSDSYILQGVVNHPFTPPEVLQSVLAMLAKDENVDVRIEASLHPSMPPAILAEMLANDADVSVRSSVAKNPSTPPSALAQHARNADEMILHNIALNPSTPFETLLYLVQITYFRNDVFQNPRLNSAEERTLYAAVHGAEEKRIKQLQAEDERALISAERARSCSECIEICVKQTNFAKMVSKSGFVQNGTHTTTTYSSMPRRTWYPTAHGGYWTEKVERTTTTSPNYESIQADVPELTSFGSSCLEKCKCKNISIADWLAPYFKHYYK